MIESEVKEKVKKILLEKIIQVRASMLVPEDCANNNEEIALLEAYTRRDVVNAAFNEARKHVHIIVEKDLPFPKAMHVHFCVVQSKDFQELLSLIKDIFRDDRG